MNTYAQNQAVNALPDRPMPNSPVFNAVEGIMKRTAELAEAIKGLGNKISPILRPEPVMMAGACGKASTEPPVVESDLTQQLRDQERALDLLIQHVIQLRDRSEV